MVSLCKWLLLSIRAKKGDLSKKLWQALQVLNPQGDAAFPQSVLIVSRFLTSFSILVRFLKTDVGFDACDLSLSNLIFPQAINLLSASLIRNARAIRSWAARVGPGPARRCENASWRLWAGFRRPVSR